MLDRFESLLRPLSVTGVYKCQTCGPGIFAWLELSLSPGEGAPLCFRAEQVTLDGLDPGPDAGLVLSAIEKGLRAREAEGTYGWPLSLRVELKRILYHPVDSRARDFERAALQSLLAALEEAGALFERRADGTIVQVDPPGPRMPITHPARFTARLS